MVTYRLYVTLIPIFKAARSRSSRSRLRSLAYYAGSSSLWRLLSLACCSFIFFVVTMIDGESASLPRRLYLTERKLHSLHGLIPQTTKSRGTSSSWLEVLSEFSVFRFGMRSVGTTSKLIISISLNEIKTSNIVQEVRLQRNLTLLYYFIYFDNGFNTL